MFAIDQLARKYRVLTVPFECEERPRYDTYFGVGIHNGIGCIYIGNASYAYDVKSCEQLLPFCEEVVWKTARSIKAISKKRIFTIRFFDGANLAVSDVAVGHYLSNH